MTTTIAHLAFPGFWEIDLLGPWEVFATARLRDAPVSPILVAPDGGEVAGVKGLTVRADYGFADMPKADVIIIPGGLSDPDTEEARPLVQWIESVAPDCDWVMSVCTGAFLLYGAGLLEGRSATTHWMHAERFAKLDGIKASAGSRYVVDGNVITSAGVSAGIDAALWLCGALFGEEIALKTTGLMEYAPEPPFDLAAARK